MSEPWERRDAIYNALAEFPTQTWLSFDDRLFRAAWPISGVRGCLGH
ncbi:MAG: hypothetical protein HQM09_06235 [Candidatus Riflebacteria bacterium]|nr:hypothetical protein [Candidatus Riflebacteria bacterium]